MKIRIFTCRPKKNCPKQVVQDFERWIAEGATLAGRASSSSFIFQKTKVLQFGEAQEILIGAGNRLLLQVFRLLNPRKS